MRNALRLFLIAALLPFATPVLLAQRAGYEPPPKPEVRLFPLAYMSNADAAKLIAPFVRNLPEWGVYEAGGAVRGVTVKASPDVLVRVDSILHALDKPPVSVVLHFELIAAVDSAVHDPAISEIDATLRGMFKFGGYRLIGQASTVASGGIFSLNIEAASGRYTLRGNLGSTVGTGANMTQQMQVDLTTFKPATKDNPINATVTIVSTGVTIPIGQTVVIGGSTGATGQGSLILAVRPDLVTSGARK